MTIEKLDLRVLNWESSRNTPAALRAVIAKVNELVEWANSPARATDPLGGFLEELSRVPEGFTPTTCCKCEEPAVAGWKGEPWCNPCLIAHKYTDPGQMLPEDVRKAVYDPVASIPQVLPYEPPPRYGDQDVEAVIEGSSHEHTLWIQDIRPGDSLVAVETNPTQVSYELRRRNGWECIATVIGPRSVQIELGDVARNAVDAAQDVQAVVQAWFNDMVIRRHTKREVILRCSCGRVLGGGKCNVCDNDE